MPKYTYITNYSCQLTGYISMLQLGAFTYSSPTLDMSNDYTVSAAEPQNDHEISLDRSPLPSR
jgi:hypothetical protein